MKHWPLNSTYFWEKAPFFRILLPFVAGIICYDEAWLRDVSIGVFFIAIITASIIYSAIIYFQSRKGIYPVFAFLLLHIILFSGGYSVCFFNDIRNNKNWFGNNINSTTLVRITDIPTEKEHSWKVPISMVSTMEGNKVIPATGNAFVYLYKDAEPMLLHKGDSILVPAKWQLIKNAGNPFEFDYAGYCRRNNIFYMQSCSPAAIRLYATNDPEHAPVLERAHDWCMLQLERYITDVRARGLLQAMLLGDEIYLDEDLRQAYTDTGIVHIIAISGGNVAIFFVAISFLLWWLKDKKYSWIKYAVAIPLVWFYVLMAGAQPSAIRAAIMFSLLAFAVMLQKNNNSLNQLFATAFLLLCAQPMWLFSVGFQLSFVAVLSLILFYRSIYMWIAPVNKIAQALWATISASIAAEILVAPLVIYYFHMFPLWFILSNVLAYIFMGVVLILSIAIIALSFIPVVAKLIATVTVWIVTIFDNLIFRLQNFNPTSFQFLKLSAVELILAYAIITGIALFAIKKVKPCLFTGLAAACLLLCCFCKDQWVRMRQQHFIVYNTNNANYTELIAGTKYTVLNTDTGGNTKTNYAIKPAHIYWQAWEKETPLRNDIMEVNGKTILILDSAINTDQTFPIDYLVINYTNNVDPVKLQRIFSPKEMIIGNIFSHKEREQLAETATDKHINMYIIGNNGAFIY